MCTALFTCADTTAGHGAVLSPSPPRAPWAAAWPPALPQQHSVVSWRVSCGWNCAEFIQAACRQHPLLVLARGPWQVCCHRSRCRGHCVVSSLGKYEWGCSEPSCTGFCVNLSVYFLRANTHVRCLFRFPGHCGLLSGVAVSLPSPGWFALVSVSSRM